MTRATRSWVSAALTGLVLAAGPLVVEAGGTGDRNSRQRPAPVAAPAQAPARIVAHATTGKIFVEWAPVAGATGYRVFRGVAGVWGAEPIATVWKSHFNNYQLVNGSLHAYKVAAFNRGGMGPVSAVVSATPLAPPANLEAVGGERQVTLTWQASTGAASYIVMRGVSWERLAQVGGNVTGTRFVDTGLTNGVKYIYRLRAIAPNSQSRLSRAAWAKPQGPPPAQAPANLSATAGSKFIKLTWSAVSGATSYRVFRTTNGTFPTTPLATVTAPSFKNEGLTNGVAYSYRVTARNGSGDGPASAAVTATPDAPPAGPINLTATGGDRLVTLGWTPVTGATSYRVYRGTATNAQGATAISPLDLATSAFVDNTVSNGTTYFYKVTAVRNGGGERRAPPRPARCRKAPPRPPTPPFSRRSACCGRPRGGRGLATSTT